MTVVRGAAYTYKARKDAAYPAFLAGGQGNCATDEFPDDFTEAGERTSQRHRRARAVKVCNGCPFKQPCLEWAVETKQQGVYGGTTTQERRRMR